MNRRTSFGPLDPAMGAAASSVFLPADSLAPDFPCPVGLSAVVTDQMLPSSRYLAGYGVDEVEGIEKPDRLQESSEKRNSAESHPAWWARVGSRRRKSPSAGRVSGKGTGERSPSGRLTPSLTRAWTRERESVKERKI